MVDVVWQAFNAEARSLRSPTAGARSPHGPNPPTRRCRRSAPTISRIATSGKSGDFDSDASVLVEVTAPPELRGIYLVDLEHVVRSRSRVIDDPRPAPEAR
jgi:hypothetical protein